MTDHVNGVGVVVYAVAVVGQVLIVSPGSSFSVIAPPEFTFPVLPIDMSLTATTAIPSRTIANVWAMMRRPILEARNFLTLIEGRFALSEGDKICGLQVHTNEIYCGITTSMSNEIRSRLLVFMSLRGITLYD